MRIFTKLFGSSREKKILEARDKFRRKSSALRQIGKAVTVAADDCYRKTLPSIRFAEGKDKQSASIRIYYEYLYFFRHLVLKNAFNCLSLMQVKVLHEYMAGLVIPDAVDVFLKQWPDELRAGMRAEFFKNLNDVEADYGNSKELFAKNDPCASDALTSKIGRNITEFAGFPNHSTTIRTVITVITDVYKAMKLEQLVDEAKEAVYAKDEMPIT